MFRGCMSGHEIYKRLLGNKEFRYSCSVCAFGLIIARLPTIDGVR